MRARKHANRYDRTHIHCRFLQTFLELIELAKQGDPSKVDIVSKDLKAATNNVDAYSALDKINDVTIGHFGKVMFNPEGKLNTFIDTIFIKWSVRCLVVWIVRMG